MAKQIEHGPTYPKILSIYKRAEKKPYKFIDGEWRKPWIEYLKDNEWRWTEKVDGTNIRIHWDGDLVRFGGKTDKAQIPVFLYDRLVEMFPNDLVASVAEGPMTLYGEGYGARIQSGGNYIPDGVSFILFDVRCGGWWLRHVTVRELAERLNIRVVPVLGAGTIKAAVEAVKRGIPSSLGKGAFEAEGLVLRPMVGLKLRSGQRVIVKLKGKDFEKKTDT